MEKSAHNFLSSSVLDVLVHVTFHELKVQLPFIGRDYKWSVS